MPRPSEYVRQKQRNNLINELRNVRRLILKPPPRISLSDWVSEYFYLSPESSSLPGKYRFNTVPFQKDVFNALSDPDVRRVCIMACSQLLKTQALLCYIAYIIHCDPAPIMCVNATDKATQSFSKDRIDTMFRDNRVLQDNLTGGKTYRKGGVSGNTIAHKSFAGGALHMASAGSAADLASKAIRYLFLDETDRYVQIGEGDPCSIAEKRTTTYWNRKVVLVSSPGDSTISKIYQEYNNSTQSQFYVPCHLCNEEQILEWHQVKWTDAIIDVHYECIHCNGHWSESEKNANVQKGRWIEARPEALTKGFHINAIYSPWLTMRELQDEFLQAKLNPDMLRTFINTRLGEPWKDKTANVKNIQFMNRLEDIDFNEYIPNQIVLITLGVDVQKDRLELEIVGWGVGDESWSLDYQILMGDPTAKKVWTELEQWIAKKYVREDGLELSIHATCIDSGMWTQEVLSFANKHQSKNVFATKGVSGFQKPIFAKRFSRSKYKGYRFYNIGVDVAKERLYHLLQLETVGPGYCHFNYDRDDTYFNQLTAESLVTRVVRGQAVKKWELPNNSVRNEALDCRVLNMAARFSFTVDFEAREKALAKKVEEQSKNKKPKDNSNKKENPIETTNIINRRRQIIRKPRRNFMSSVLNI